MKRSGSFAQSLANGSSHPSKSKRERFMVRLVDKVRGILESAVQNDDKSRLTILQEFFSNISCQVEDEVLLYLDSDCKIESKSPSITTTSTPSAPSNSSTTNNTLHSQSHTHSRTHSHTHLRSPSKSRTRKYIHSPSKRSVSTSNFHDKDITHNNNLYSSDNDDVHSNTNFMSDYSVPREDIDDKITTNTHTNSYTNNYNSINNSTTYSRDMKENSVGGEISSIDTTSILTQSADPLATSTTPAPALVSPPPPLISSSENLPPASMSTSSPSSSSPSSSSFPFPSPSSSSSSTSSVPAASASASASSTTTIPSTPKQGADNTRPIMYYYELLAERFATHPADVTSLLQVIVSLWSNTTFPIIFAALFYKWIFRHGTLQMKNFNVFIKGANRLFWLDLETINTRFAPIYQFLNTEVLVNYNRLNSMKDPTNAEPPHPVMSGTVLSRFLLDFFNILARFFFYYQKVTDLPLFIEKTQAIFSNLSNFHAADSSTTNPGDDSNIVTLASTDISAQNTTPSRKELAKISAADNFVDCTIRQIKLIRNEYVLVKYIQKCVHFRGLTLTDTTQVKLQTLLYDYTSPGGPYYPTRSVRHAATESLDALFPTGKLPRRYIHLFFRLLHPYYATRSIFHWVYSRVKPFLFIFGAPLEEEEDENVLQSIE